MEKRATMHDVADLAGVSQATVSLVLNGVANSRISKATRRRVQEAAETLGYRRGQVHPLPADRTRIIGLFIDEATTTPMLGPLLEGARDEAALQDVAVAVFFTGGTQALEQAALDMLVAQNALGVIYSTLITREVTVPEYFSRLPLVLLNCYERKVRFPSAVPGDMVGGYIATETLIRAGHRRIAHLAGEHIVEAAVHREKGFRKAMERHGIPVDERLVTLGGWSIAAGRERALTLLSQPERPSAIFCYCDRMAMGCYEAAHLLGLSIPEDLSVIGFDDEDISAGLNPPLSTMVLPHDEMARWAVGQLLDDFEGLDADERLQKLKIECQFVDRESIRPPKA
jgi:Transcriptional regulators